MKDEYSEREDENEDNFDEEENENKYEEENNIHEPQYDPSENPPKLVLIQGPPRSGKTTLIRSLIKHYTGQTVSNPKGPITIKTSRKQRITLLECPQDMGSMSDMAKIPDIVLCMIDASVGFEMETFEFLAVLQIHGFPKCIGVASHLDYYRTPEKLKKTKQTLRKRLEVEVTKETKLFFLGGLKGEQYRLRDVQNLARFISVIIPRELEFKIQHPHLLVDRVEILTENKASFTDDTTIDVSLFGYVRGSNLISDKTIYVPGLGYIKPSEVKEVIDPIFIEKPKKAFIKKKKRNDQSVNTIKNNDKIAFDTSEEESDTDFNNKKSISKVSAEAGARRTLRRAEKLIYAPQSDIGLTMFDETGDYVSIPEKYVIFSKKEGEDIEIDQQQGVRMIRELSKREINLKDKLNKNDTILIGDIPISNNEEIKLASDLNKNKELNELSKLAEQVANKTDSLTESNQLNKGKTLSSIIYNNQSTSSFRNIFDSTKFYVDKMEEFDIYKQTIRYRFVTSFEEDSDIEDENASDDYEPLQIVDNEQLEIENDKAVSRGKYTRVTIKGIKFKFTQEFSIKTMILSQFPLGEDTRGYLLIKLKKHRFYKALLKNSDPLLFSVGFQRFQSIPYFCKKDESDKLRVLKYTPRHDFCYCVAFGNYAPTQTGVAAFHTMESSLGRFRVSAVGVVMGFSSEYSIMKKLKLVGEPFKIYKKTAFVKNMFNSELEIAKFIGAKIKTVSGIRGQIKKACREEGAGAFRAAFEDKILLSDIVFLRTWYTLKLEKYYNPMISFNATRLLRTTWQLRKQLGISNPEADKVYPRLERPNKKFSPLVVPKKLQGSLPFKTKEKITEADERNNVTKKENKFIKSVSTEKEKEARYLIQRLKLIAKEKDKLKKESQKQKLNWKKKWKIGMERNMKMAKKKMEKQKYTKKGKQSAHK